MRLIVCGGRDYLNSTKMFSVLTKFHNKHTIDLLIEGGATGADYIARQFAKANGIPFKTFKADWSTHRKAAGPIRNKRMIVEGKAEAVMAAPGGAGTANMVAQARKARLRIFSFKDPTYRNESITDICYNKHGGNPESNAAFTTISPKIRDQQQRIIDYVRKHPGVLCYELEAPLNMRRSTASARVSELRKSGVIVPTGVRRPTASGCNAAELKLAPSK